MVQHEVTVRQAGGYATKSLQNMGGDTVGRARSRPSRAKQQPKERTWAQVVQENLRPEQETRQQQRETRRSNLENEDADQVQVANDSRTRRAGAARKQSDNDGDVATEDVAMDRISAKKSAPQITGGKKSRQPSMDNNDEEIKLTAEEIKEIKRKARRARKATLQRERRKEGRVRRAIAREAAKQEQKAQSESRSGTQTHPSTRKSESRSGTQTEAAML